MEATFTIHPGEFDEKLFLQLKAMLEGKAGTINGIPFELFNLILLNPLFIQYIQSFSSFSLSGTQSLRNSATQSLI
jgi:hypothetical protein